MTSPFRLAVFTVLALMAVPNPGLAYYAGGHEYVGSCNPDGYVLTSKNPVSRSVGTGAGTRYETEHEKLYLGKSCDAFHRLYGQGTWCWANGGFKADFQNFSFGFARQELSCPRNDDPGNSCIC